MDYSLPGSSAHGIFQTSVPEWDAIATVYYFFFFYVIIQWWAFESFQLSNMIRFMF